MGIMRGAYLRAVVFCEATKFAVDVFGHHLGASNPADPKEEYFSAANGQGYPESREHTLDLRLLRSADAETWAEMRRHAQGAAGPFPVKAILLGWPETRGKHRLWLEESEPAGLPGQAAFGSFADDRVHLETGAFHAAVFDVQDLLSPFPWAGMEATENDDGDWVFAGPEGYEGPEWEVSQGDSVSVGGAATISDEAVFTLPFPVPGCALRLDVPAGGTGTLSAISAGGTVLATAAAGTSLVLPGPTWSVRVTITGDLGARPSLLVARVGRATQAVVYACPVEIFGGASTPPGAPQDYHVDLGDTAGTVTLDYSNGNAPPDSYELIYEGQVVLATGPVVAGAVTWDYPATGSTILTVRVIPDEDPITLWDFRLSCPV